MTAKGWEYKKICTKRAVNGQICREGWGWGTEDYACLRSLNMFILPNSVRPRTEFLIGTIKLQPNPESRMCHLDISLLEEKEKDGELC